MPPVQAKSKLAAKLGASLDKAVQAHAADEADYGFVAIPPGITNGIAQLSKAYFDEYKNGDQKGQLYLRMVGVVVEPKSINVDGQTVKVEGLQTSLMRPICPTKKKTLDENVAEALNDIRILGAYTSEVKNGAQLEALVTALQEAKPFFYFSTSKSEEKRKPDGTVEFAARVWENWNGNKGLEEYVPNEDAGGVDDDTAGGATGASIPDQGAEYNDASDLLSLGARCDAADGDQEAEAQLIAAAEAAGIERDAEGAFPGDSWTELAQMIMDGGSSTTDDGAAVADEPFTPAKGDVFKFQLAGPDGKPLKNPKTKKPMPAVEVEVVTVDAKTETVTVKNLDDSGKPILGPNKKPIAIKWADLIRE